jgi:hypothetical protein
MHDRRHHTRAHGPLRGRRRGLRGVDIERASWGEPRRSRGRRRMRRSIPRQVLAAFRDSSGDGYEELHGIDGRRGGIRQRASGARSARDAGRLGASNLYRDAWAFTRRGALGPGAQGLPVRSTSSPIASSLEAPRP